MHDPSVRRLVSALFLACAAAVPAGDARTQVLVVSGTLEEADAHPGEAYAGVIRLRNGGTTAQHARIYQADYRFFADGRSLFESPGAHARSNAGWLEVGLSSVTLAPGEETSVRYEVRVPDRRDLRGTYWSVVMVETVAPAAPRSGRGMGITPVIRYAVQVATHVGGAGEARLSFQSPRVAAPAGGGSSLAIDLANIGERADRVDLRLDVFDASGAPARRVQVARGLLYPGTSLRQTFDLGDLRPGVYRALVVADTGGEEIYGAEYTIRL